MSSRLTSMEPGRGAATAPAMLRAFVALLREHPELHVRALFGSPASPARLTGARLPPDLARFYGHMDGTHVHWWWREAYESDASASGAITMPSLSRNLRGWTRADFFTDNKERPALVRVPDEVPLARRDQFRPAWMDGDPSDDLLGLWDTAGDTFSDVTLQGLDDYVAQGIQRLFMPGWTALLTDFESPEVEARVVAARSRLGLDDGCFARALAVHLDREAQPSSES